MPDSAMQVVSEIEGWRGLEDGIRYVSDLGPDAGRMTVRTDRPLRAHAALVRDLIAAHPEVSRPALAAASRVVTAEGEHGFFVTVVGEAAGGAARLRLGVLLGDREYLRVEGVSLAALGFAALDHAVEHVVFSTRVGLGVRPRRFFYAPPRGWQGIARDLMTEWIPPEFPGDRTLLSIFPAAPITAAAETSIDTLLASDWAAGFALDSITRPAMVVTPKLRGHSWDVTGRFGGRRPSFCRIVLLRDPICQYSFVLEIGHSGRRAEHLEILRQVVASAVPLPRASPPDVAVLTRTLAHWTT